jgi:hypothetical protein
MKPILIVPACGASSRFPGLPPKWSLKHPSGLCMLAESIRGLSGYSEVHIALLEEYRDTPLMSKLMMDISEVCSDDEFSKHRTIHFLNPTASAVETVYQVLGRIGGDFPFVSKDCDNYFELTLSDEDFVAIGESHSLEPGDFSKSCVDGCGYGDDGIYCDSIKEKYWLPGGFCAGAYGFKSSREYLEVADWVGYNVKRPEMPEVYQSDVINHMIDLGHKFRCVSVEEYRDFGTPQAWTKELARHDPH